jgi:hypothetical protein
MQTGSRMGERPLTLTERETLDRSRIMAEKVQLRGSLVSSKASDNKKWQKQIDDVDAEIDRLSRIVLDGFENRNQGDLFADQVLSDEEAKKALADVAAAAGAGAPAAPLPSEPHKFVEDPAKEDQCLTCGSGEEDPVHTGKLLHAFQQSPDAMEGESLCVHCGYEEAAALHRRHEPMAVSAENPDPELEGKCLNCGLALDDLIHQPAPAAAPPAEAVALEAFTCARCHREYAKVDGHFIDSDAFETCTNCRQLAIERGEWKHPFEADPTVRRRKTKEPVCKHCERVEDDPVHAPSEAESLEIAKARVTGPALAPDGTVAGGPFDFTEDEPPPQVAPGPEVQP